MKTTQEKIEVMQAYEDGKTIQVIGGNNNYWEDLEAGLIPTWNWTRFDYRIKPEKKEPTYRPYENTDEMIADFKQRFKGEPKYTMPLIWVMNNSLKKKSLITSFWGNAVGFDSTAYNLKFLASNCTYLDGSPCGKLVE